MILNVFPKQKSFHDQTHRQVQAAMKWALHNAKKGNFLGMKIYSLNLICLGCGLKGKVCTFWKGRKRNSIFVQEERIPSSIKNWKKAFSIDWYSKLLRSLMLAYLLLTLTELVYFFFYIIHEISIFLTKSFVSLFYFIFYFHLCLRPLKIM